MNTNRTALVTGASGFVGQQVCDVLLAAGWKVRGCVRSVEQARTLPPGCTPEIIPDITDEKDWSERLRGVTAVVHLVAKTHCIGKQASDDIDTYRRLNVTPSVRLAESCSKAGTERFVYMSSIKAIGEGGDAVYSEASACAPEDAYGKSKLEAELRVRQILKGSSTRLTILRPPLVYGDHARGNLALLLKGIDRGLPLPLRCDGNARSMIHVRSLAEAVRCAAEDTESIDRLFTVSDPDPHSTTELVNVLANGLGKPARLFGVPYLLTKLVGIVLGKSNIVRRLFESLVVDPSKICNELHWRPVVRWHDGVHAMARNFASANCHAAVVANATQQTSRTNSDRNSLKDAA